MDVVIVAIIGGLIGAGWEWWRRRRVAVRLSKKVIAQLPEAVVCKAIAEYFEGRGWTSLAQYCKENGRPFNPVKGGAAFLRGDSSIPYVSAAANIGWRDMPLIVSIGMGGADAETTIHVEFSSMEGVRFSPAASRFFIEQAAGEFKGLLSFLEAVAKRRSEPSGTGPGANGRHRHRWMPEDDAGGAKQARTHDASHDADLALLGLERGATLEQVKKAYRIASFKYHPDRLTGKNVEPHLVELAVQRFKEVSAANQRLCEHFAQPQHA
ncbi:MAG: J domain-containing protein [Phycisphaerae bacterium]|nr:MAG: J domain-containing protein [Planctomycetota bacterium]MBE7456093.1 J domain-containing protein [Planctomycetia bacterium]MCL4718603.1 J domain-containing protein [Phycisphaerae bacterium]MCQ3921269.1 hypothetical protein [Planctomycetota bacterium]